MNEPLRKLPDTMTAEEFKAWPGDGAGGKYELVDGELRMMSPATTTHGTMQANLSRLIGNHLLGGRCRVLSEPAVEIRVRADVNRRVPDLGVTCTPDQRGEVELPDPILLVEIMSPGNKADTWSNVWAYTTIPTVREILIVSSTRIFAQLLRRGPDESWPKEAAEIAADGALALETIALTLPLKDAYAGTYLMQLGA